MAVIFNSRNYVPCEIKVFNSISKTTRMGVEFYACTSPLSICIWKLHFVNWFVYRR